MRRYWIITKHTYLGYHRDNCPQLAAAISYYVLFSIVPLAIFTLSVFGFFLTDDSIRRDIVDRILDQVPFSQTEGRDAVDDAVNNVRDISGPIAVFGVIATLWTASAVFASLRKSLNTIFGGEEHRPFAKQKLVDFAQVGVLSVMLLASLVATGVLRTAREVSVERMGAFADENLLWEIPAILLPAVLSGVAFLLLYRFVPAAHPQWRDALPGAMLATLLLEALKNSFAIYVANFNNFNLVYGSLAGILIFVFYVFLASNVLLIGAELTRTSQRVRIGDLHHEIYPQGPGETVAQQALRALRGLFVRQ